MARVIKWIGRSFRRLYVPHRTKSGKSSYGVYGLPEHGTGVISIPISTPSIVSTMTGVINLSRS